MGPEIFKESLHEFANLTLVDMFLNYPVLSVMVSDPSPVVPVY
jgi:hypothetical protein